MSLVRFSKQVTKDEDLNKVQDNLVRTLNPVFNTQTLGGNLLQSVPLVVGSNSIDHKLGRNLIGWMLTRQRSSASIYDIQDSNTLPASTLILVSDAVVTIDLYVF